jgi:hypothetical protein
VLRNASLIGGIFPVAVALAHRPHHKLLSFFILQSNRLKIGPVLYDIGAVKFLLQNPSQKRTPSGSRRTARHYTSKSASPDAYQKGDRVDFGGTVYVSVVDGNVWQPRIFGGTKAE